MTSDRPGSAFSRFFPGDSVFYGLYIHVPFCLRKCGYCAFYSIVPEKDLIKRFLKKIEIDLSAPETIPLLPGVKSVFIGGGNPTSIGESAFTELLGVIKSKLDPSRIIEWTVETNPETFPTSICEVLKPTAGLRVSIGLQRLKDDELQILCRQSSHSKGVAALESALSITSKVGIDLILGIPGCPSVKRDLEKLLSRYQLAHVSSYFLTKEEGTPLSNLIASGKFPDPENVGPEELFEVIEVLENFGFEHYEISNFARDGMYCLHNLNYWLGGDFIGIGPSAVGTISGKRISQPSSLEDWLSGKPPEVEVISRNSSRREYIMLRMRLLREGLNLQSLAELHGKLPDSFSHSVKKHMDLGNIEEAHENIRLTSKGLPFANKVISDLF